MADENKEAVKTEKKDEKPQQAGQSKINILTWTIIAVIVIFHAASGFVLGRLLAGSPAPQTAKTSPEKKHAEESMSENPEACPNDTWYYSDLESIVVNPDEPGATRFVRVGLTLEISSALSHEKAKELFDTKKPLLVNWLNLYFKSLTLNEMQNDRDMKLILSQICDAFNEILFPDAKPQIKKILIKEFNIQ